MRTPIALSLAFAAGMTFAPSARAELLIYHDIVTDGGGKIVPWYDASRAKSYDHVLGLVWHFWDTINDCGGYKAYLMHRTWDSTGCPWQSLGGDQLAMALSSWSLYYPYAGNQAVKDNMKLIADFVLAHGMSPASSTWPNLPFPTNTSQDSGVLDGDVMNGAGYLQTDKAGSFGVELVTLYEMTGDRKYLDAAIGIATTLAQKTVTGTAKQGPLPYKVHYQNGDVPTSSGFTWRYTTNWTGTIRLFDELVRLGEGDVALYQGKTPVYVTFLKQFPVKTQDWGNFFEDNSGYSNSQINAVTAAMWMLEHPTEWGSTYRNDTRAILDWSLATFGNPDWAKYGVTAINEQTAFLAPGNSHTSREASVELRYAEDSGDWSRKDASLRQLDWATYMVDFDGKNFYPTDAVWFTDGYGDYVRHYLRAMASLPEIAPDNQDHLLRWSSPIRQIVYGAKQIAYSTFDKDATELLKVTTFVPSAVAANGVALPRLTTRAALAASEGYTLGADGDLPTVLRIHHAAATSVLVAASGVSLDAGLPPTDGGPSPGAGGSASPGAGGSSAPGAGGGSAQPDAGSRASGGAKTDGGAPANKGGTPGAGGSSNADDPTFTDDSAEDPSSGSSCSVGHGSVGLGWLAIALMSLASLLRRRTWVAPSTMA